jgi:chromosome partitioning protein
MRSHWRTEFRDVLLIDADDQETSSDFTQLRTEKLGSAGYTCIRLNGSAVRSETLKLKGKYDDIIIDTGGRDTTSQRAALSVADLLLVPFVPRSFDIWTLQKMVELVEEMRQANPKLSVCTFLNRADPRGTDNGEAAEQLKEAEREALHFCMFQLGSRKAFGNAASLGLAVTELKPQDEKASYEIGALYHYVFDVALKMPPPAKVKSFGRGKVAA